MNTPAVVKYVMRSMALMAGLSLLIACSDGGNNNSSGSQTSGENAQDPNVIAVAAGDNFQTRLVEALIQAKPGNVIELPAGEFTLNTSISLDVDNVTVRGKGLDSTVLNFATQTSGGESVLVTSNNVVLEDFAVVDPPSDGIKFKFTDEATVQITQSGRAFGFRADYGPGNVNLYAGRTYDDAKKPDEKGEVALVACGTDSVAGNDPAFDELGRFTAKTKPGKVKATLKGVTYFSDPGIAAPEAGTCKWSLTRIDATNGAIPTSCDPL